MQARKIIEAAKGPAIIIIFVRLVFILIRLGAGLFLPSLGELSSFYLYSVLSIAEIAAAFLVFTGAGLRAARDFNISVLGSAMVGLITALISAIVPIIIIVLWGLVFGYVPPSVGSAEYLSMRVAFPLAEGALLAATGSLVIHGLQLEHMLPRRHAPPALPYVQKTQKKKIARKITKRKIAKRKKSRKR